RRPIGLVRDGDVVTIDAERRVIDSDVSDAEMARRRADWKAPALKYTKGTLKKYASLVSDASSGCVTDGPI
ncbi:hypothetical protein BJF96_g10094, partial [Verticillium dahliae]